MRRLGSAGAVALTAFALTFAAQAAPAGAAETPTYDLNGTWVATAIGCNGESEAVGSVQITGWSATTGRFESATVNRAGESKSGSGLETGSTVTLTILSAPGATGLLPGQVFRSGSSLTMTLSIVCKNGAAGSFTLVNRSPGVPASPGAPVAGPGPAAPESQISEQEHDLSSSCGEAKGELLRDITDNMLGLSFAVATPGKLEATVAFEGSGGTGGASSLAGMPPAQPAFAATAPATLVCEAVFSATTAGSASVPRVRSIPAVAASGEAKAAQRFTVAELSQAFVISGNLTLHIPLTGAGRSLIKKLHAADRAYHHKHPHGHSPPNARLKLMLSYTPGA
jgi:hypothetical protein